MMSSDFKVNQMNLAELMNEFNQKIAEEKQGTIREEAGESSGESGSDSDQSDDNLDADMLIKIMPQKVTKRKIGNLKRKRN